MFQSLISQLSNRTGQIMEVWQIIDRLEKQEITTHTPEPGLRTLKGLMFVQFYAAYEFTTVKSFAAAIQAFNTHAIPLESTRRSILSLAFDQQLKSLRDLSDRRSWKRRVELFTDCDSTQPCSIPETLFPQDDSHFRAPQLQTICELLGLPEGALIAEPRHLGWIKEVVEHRNAIAHGRETAETIGSRYSSPELYDRLQQLDLLCNHILLEVQTHSASATSFNR